MGFFTKLVGYIRNRASFKREIEDVPFIVLQGWVKELRDKISNERRIDEDLNSYFQQLNGSYIIFEKSIAEMAAQALLWEKQDRELGMYIDLQAKMVVEILKVKERPSIDTVFQFNERLGEKIDMLLHVLEKLEKINGEMEGSQALLLFKDFFISETQKLLAFRQAFEVKLFQSGLRTVQTLSHKVELLRASVLRRDKLQQKLKEKMERLENADTKKKEKEAVLITLKAHPLYEHFSQVEDRKNQLKAQLQEYLDEAKLLFLNLKSVLESYRKMGSNMSLLNSYIDDPASAFVHDEELAVIHLLEHVRAVIHQEKIVIDEEELPLIQSTLDKATSQYLRNVQQQCFSLKQQIESFDTNSKVDKTYSLKVQDVHYRYSHFVQQSQRLSEEIAHLEEEFKEKKEQIKRERQLFENLVRIGLQREIKIVGD